MIKRKILIGCLLLGGVMAGCSPKVRYEVYRARDPELNIQVEYPAGWIIQEYRDPKAGYTNVVFVDKAGEGLRPMMTIMAKKAASMKDPAMTPQAFSRAIVRARLRNRPSKVLSEKQTRMAGLDANETAVTYQGRDKIFAPDAKDITVKEKMVVFKKDDTIYVLRLQAELKDFPHYEKVYRRAVGTLRLIR